jgi:polysaccharide chain length determinant protein (PEP-CTERM system associated)
VKDVNTPVTVRDYLRLLFRRKYVIVAPILCSLFLILPIWKIVPEKYRANALVKRKDLALTNAAGGSSLLRDIGPVPVETMRAEILTWTNLDRVIKQLKLDVDLKTAADWQEEYEKLKTSITIKTAAQGRGVDLIEIAVMDKDASSSQKIANAIADNYVEESQRNSRDDTLQAIDYYKTQCDDNLAIIRKMNIELDKYTREHWTELPEVKRGILTTLQTLRVTEGEHLLLLSAGQNRLTEIDRQVKEVEKTIKSDIQTTDNPARAELVSQLMARQKRLTEMMVNYTEDHPQVKAVREEIATLQAQLKDTPERVPGSIHETINPLYQTLLQSRMTAEQEVKADEASLRETQAQIMANEASIRKVVDEEKQYADIQRQHDEAKEAYEEYHKTLLALQNRSRVQSEPNGTQVEIIARALEPAEPYHGYRLPLAIACVGGAAAAGLVLTFLLEFVDHSLRGPDDAAESLGVPVLATLTEISAPVRHDPGRARRRLILYIGAAILLAGVVSVTLVEGFVPGALGRVVVYLTQLTH